MDKTIIKFLNEGAIHPTRASHKRAAKNVMAKSFCSKTEAYLHYQSLACGHSDSRLRNFD